jgi:V/A-type H+-transporting ATPase subunit I
MFRTTLKMKKLHLLLMADDAQRAANALADLAVVHLKEERADDQLLDELPAVPFHDVYHRLKSRYKKIVSFLPDNEQLLEQGLLDVSSESLLIEQLHAVDDELKQLWIEVSALEEKRRQFSEKISSLNQLQSTLQRFEALEMDLSRVGRQSHFLDIKAGTVPASNRSRLEKALSINGNILSPFYQSEGVDYVLVVSPTSQSEDVHGVLKSADFREILVPKEFEDRPEMVERKLQDNRQGIDQSVEEISQKITDMIEHKRPLLEQAKQLIQQAMPYAEIASYLHGKGPLVSLQGWVPANRIGEIRKALKDQLQHAYVDRYEEPGIDDYEEIPTELKKSRWITPFQTLVSQYGLPQYREFDPGLLFALSYTLMFGMMFGDVGHGAAIILIAWYFRKVLKSLAFVGTLAGLSSILFGFLYGSVFGYEDILHPLWLSPMHDPQHVLTLALYWGIGFLIIANILSVRNLLSARQTQLALYSPSGLAGLLFYLAAAATLIWVLETGAGIPFWSLPALAVMMLVMLVFQWKHSSGSLFERILVVFIEGLEIVISNMSATLSFLRVAAFALNHIALAAAIFALASMMDSFGHGVAIVLGNIFIIVLEGGIVAIQCLRLEYYEGFSRFFSGKGKPFKPLQRNYSLN